MVFSILKMIPFLQLGEWSYTIQGQGLRPTVMSPVVVSCGLGEATQTLLHFKNPLDQAINVQCKLLDKNKVERNGRISMLFSKSYYHISTRRPFGVVRTSLVYWLR